MKELGNRMIAKVLLMKAALWLLMMSKQFSCGDCWDFHLFFCLNKRSMEAEISNRHVEVTQTQLYVIGYFLLVLKFRFPLELSSWLLYIYTLIPYVQLAKVLVLRKFASWMIKGFQWSKFYLLTWYITYCNGCFSCAITYSTLGPNVNLQ